MFDLNGYTLTYSSDEYDTVIKVNAKVNLTLEDSDPAQTGMLTGGNATYGGGVFNGGKAMEPIKPQKTVGNLVAGMKSMPTVHSKRVSLISQMLLSMLASISMQSGNV